MNKVGSESLNLTVTKAAENIIDTKGVNGKRLELGVECARKDIRSVIHLADASGELEGWIPSWYLPAASLMLCSEYLLACVSNSALSYLRANTVSTFCMAGKFRSWQVFRFEFWTV